MHWRRDKNGIFVKMDRGEDLFPSLERFAEKELPRGGMVVMAIGMLENSVVGYYNGREYEKRTFEKGHELLGLHGSIRILEDGGSNGVNGEGKGKKRVGLHIHCMMANERHEVVGGHLFSATVNPLVEMLIVPAEDTGITVKFNEETGLDEMALE